MLFMDIHLDILGYLWISMHGLAMGSRSRVVNNLAKRPIICLKDIFDANYSKAIRNIIYNTC